jgi:predicted kinase
MRKSKATLHMLCGKIAAGKSILAADLAERHRALLVSVDFWTSRLFGPEMKEIADYVRFSRRLREAMGPHLADILRAGLSVVLDFPANTSANRAWMKGIAEAAGAGALLHYLDVPDETCRARLHERNARGDHDFAVTDAQFDLISSYFEPPAADEGIAVVAHPWKRAGGGASEPA